MEEKEAHLKARLEHIDETLRSARLSGYLQMRTVIFYKLNLYFIYKLII